MLKTKQLEHLLKLALLSAYIEDERPVSILISARVESGKTELIGKANGLKGVLYLNDVTAYGLQRKYLQSIADGKVKTVIIPDLITPLSKGANTVETFVSFMNGLIEEGVSEVQTYAMSIKIRNPARCNIITSIAREHLGDARHRWTKAGFLSRVIPVSYEYGASSVYDIMQSIANREYRGEADFSNLELPDKNVSMVLPEEIAQKIAALAPQIVDAEKLYGFRLQKQLQVLCMASALFNKRTTVQELDFEIIKQLSDFINLKYKQI